MQPGVRKQLWALGWSGEAASWAMGWVTVMVLLPDWGVVARVAAKVQPKGATAETLEGGAAVGEGCSSKGETSRLQELEASLDSKGWSTCRWG